MARIRTTVALIEDDLLHAEQYRANLALDPDLVLVAQYTTARAAMAQIAGVAPDVALVDLGLPDVSGFDVICHIRATLPHTAVMVVSVFGGERNLAQAIASGATGYLLKDSLSTDFNEAIHALRAGESPISPSLARHLLKSFAAQPTQPTQPAEIQEASPLSRRELTILQSIARGDTVAEISAQLFISPFTVKTHVQNIYRKLEARSRQHAVFLAQQRGLLKR
jgi:DNA-binding NarL/FixJ family response regulator